MFANENSEMDDDRLVTTSNRTRNRLYAVKLVMTYPIAVGELKWGGEYSYVHRTDRFDNPQSILPATCLLYTSLPTFTFLSSSCTWNCWVAGS